MLWVGGSFDSDGCVFRAVSVDIDAVMTQRIFNEYCCASSSVVESVVSVESVVGEI